MHLLGSEGATTFVGELSRMNESRLNHATEGNSDAGVSQDTKSSDSSRIALVLEVREVDVAVYWST